MLSKTIHKRLLASKNWVDSKRLNFDSDNPLFYEWLKDDRSLTKKLQKEFVFDGAGVSVELLNENFNRPEPDEHRLLHIARKQLSLIRTINLLGNGKEQVFARTVIPLETLKRYPQLRFLGERSLGSVIFASSGIRRSRIQVLCIPLQTASFQKLWARRSVLSVRNSPLLVYEVFLPEFQNKFIDKSLPMVNRGNRL